VPSLAFSRAACNLSLIFSAFLVASSASFSAFLTAAYFTSCSAFKSASTLTFSAFLIVSSAEAFYSVYFLNEALSGLLRTDYLEASLAASFSLASFIFSSSSGFYC